MKRRKFEVRDDASRKFRAYLRNARIERGLSQADIASMLGYESAQYVSDWERGISSPPMKKLARIADILAVDLDRLFDLLLEMAKERVASDLSEEYGRIRKRVRR